MIMQLWDWLNGLSFWQFVGVVFWAYWALHYFVYCISTGWHKGKAKYPTRIINTGETELRITSRKKDGEA